MILRIVISGVYVDNILILKKVARPNLQCRLGYEDLISFNQHLSLL